MFSKLLRSPGAIFTLFACATLGVTLAAAALQAQQVSDGVMKAEAERVAVVEKAKPAVVAVFGPGGKGGGSGVLISEDGYALTNFHVVAGPGAGMQCGLPDGVLYDAVLVGLDRVGDVALIKLLPKPGKEGHKFPFAPLGDSDKCREGDWSLAMGNPFLLATDFTPTVTFGLISGVHRYQYPQGTLLEYTDCIQIDTSINPGNSGGPLFNMKGELIGINGRGSFDKRPRINSGVGYAISINQIKNFIGHLKAGLDSDHATLGAAVTTQTDKSGIGRLEFTQMLDTADIFRRGVTFGDELVSLDGRPIASGNHLKNILGLFPKGWRIPIEYRKSAAGADPDETGVRKETLVRLLGHQRKLIAIDPEDKDNPPPKDEKNGIKPPAPGSQAAKYFIAKDGFANYWFNRDATNELFKHLKKRGDFTALGGKWELDGNIRFLRTKSSSAVKIEIADEKAKEGSGINPVIRMKVGEFPVPDELYPQKSGQDLLLPKESGGFMAAMYLYRNLLVKGAKAFETEFLYGGYEPCYPPSGDKKKTVRDRRVMTEVLIGKSGPFTVKFFFNVQDTKEVGRLEFFEVRLSDTEDPCEVYCSNYKALSNGQLVPHTLTIVHGDMTYGTIELNSFKLNPAQ